MTRRIYTIGFCLAVLCQTAAYGLTLIPPQYTTPARFGSNLLFSQRTGTQLLCVDAETKRDVWVWSSGDRSVRTRPTIVDGVAYIWAGNVMKDSRACAIDCRTGKSIWETPTGGWTFASAIMSGETVLFPVEAQTDEIHAFDRRTGKKKWMLKDHDLMAVHGGRILAATDACRQLVLLDAEQGKEILRLKLDSVEYPSPECDCTPGGLAVISSDYTLMALDIPSGTVRWRQQTHGIGWAPSIHGNQLFLLCAEPSKEEAGGHGHQLLEVRDVRDGKPGRRVELKAGRYTDHPAIVFDKMIVVATGGVLLGLDSGTLEQKWRVPTGDVYQLKRDGNTVFVGAVGPNLTQVDATTGAKLWSYDYRPTGEPK